MSALHRKAVRGGAMSGLPPMPGGGSRSGSSVRRMAKGAGIRKRSYSPVSWKQYWDDKLNVETDNGKFTVYSRGEGSTLVLLLHGGGYSGLTWSLVAEELYELADCRIVAMDLRGHGESVRGDDMSRDRLAEDVSQVGDQLIQLGKHDKIVYVGHSMGGAVAVSAAQKPGVAGLVVIDVVEGTAVESLVHMQNFLKSRPQQFKSISQAIEWCVRSGQVRNLDSAKVSMPGQIATKDGRLGSLLVEDNKSSSCEESNKVVEKGVGHLAQSAADAIQEEAEETDETPETTFANNIQKAEAKVDSDNFARPCVGDGGPGQSWTWAVDLPATEPHWPGWFQDLSTNFLAAPTSKLLLLAGVDRLDKDLTVGQMQGKFQLIVLPQVGHAIHEDSPDKVAEVLAQFLVRNRLAESKDPSRISAPRGPFGMMP